MYFLKGGRAIPFKIQREGVGAKRTVRHSRPTACADAGAGAGAGPGGSECGVACQGPFSGGDCRPPSLLL